jgi:hypothetical protein
VDLPLASSICFGTRSTSEIPGFDRLDFSGSVSGNCVMRINETSPIEIHIVPCIGAPQGIGEAGTSVVFPALAAAIHAGFERHGCIFKPSANRRIHRIASRTKVDSPAI